MPLDNAWFAHSGNGTNKQYFFRIFDVNGGGQYIIDTAVIAARAQPPVIQFISDKGTPEGGRGVR